MQREVFPVGLLREGWMHVRITGECERVVEEMTRQLFERALHVCGGLV